jgi:hypothetical protein
MVLHNEYEKTEDRMQALLLRESRVGERRAVGGGML